jgi:hypothetical protein
MGTNDEKEPSPKKRTAGRPLKPTGKAGRAYCYLTTDERAELERVALARGLTINDILRRGKDLVLIELKET